MTEREWIDLYHSGCAMPLLCDELGMTEAQISNVFYRLKAERKLPQGRRRVRPRSHALEGDRSLRAEGSRARLRAEDAGTHLDGRPSVGFGDALLQRLIEVHGPALRYDLFDGGGRSVGRTAVRLLKNPARSPA